MISAVSDAWNDKRTTYGILFLVVAALCAAGWYGYSYYVDRKEQAAYKDLAESIDGYVKARSLEQGEQNWADVERAFDVGAQRHGSSSLYPYFLAYKADALVQQGKLKEAAAVLDTVVSNIGKQQPLHSVYALKRALVKIDSDDEPLRTQGKAELTALAQDLKSPVHTLAAQYKDKLSI